MYNSIRVILNANFLACRNQYLSQSVIFNRAITSSIIWFFGIASFYWLSDLFITQNSNPNVLTTRNRVSILTIIGTVILVKLVVEGTIQIFYESEETTFLFHTPISTLSILVANLITLIGRYLPKMVLFLVPPWLVTVREFHLSWPFYLLVFPICFCYLLIIVSQTVLGVLVLMKIPPLQLRNVINRRAYYWPKIGLKFLTISIAILTVILSIISLVWFSETKLFNDVELWQKRTTNWLIQSNLAWGPIEWMYQFFLCFASSQPKSNSAYPAIKLIATVLLVNTLTIVLSNWFYRSSWECQFTSPVSHDNKEMEAKNRFDSKINSLFWQFPICASVYKDLLVFTGKKGRWLTIVFFSLIQIFMVYSVSLSIQQTDENNYVVFGLLSQINLYSVILTFGLTFYGFKADREIWWLLQCSPRKAEFAYISKYLAAMFLAFAYSSLWTVLLLVSTSWPINDWSVIFLISFLSLTATIALNTTVGCLPWVNNCRSDNSYHSAASLLTVGLTMLVNTFFLIMPFLVWQMTLNEEIQIGQIKGPILNWSLAFLLLTIALMVISISVLIGRYSLNRSLSP